MAKVKIDLDLVPVKIELDWKEAVELRNHLGTLKTGKLGNLYAALDNVLSEMEY